jgi:predicted aspartyl protease
MARYRYVDYGQHPAPFVHVSVRCEETRQQTDQIAAQIDSGADRTVIPAALVNSLNLEKMGTMPVCGLEGRVDELPVYLVEVLVHDYSPIRVAVLAGQNEPFVLLGRDVLNHFRVLLDGPAKALEIG